MKKITIIIRYKEDGKKVFIHENIELMPPRVGEYVQMPDDLAHKVIEVTWNCELTFAVVTVK